MAILIRHLSSLRVKLNDNYCDVDAVVSVVGIQGKFRHYVRSN